MCRLLMPLPYRSTERLQALKALSNTRTCGRPQNERVGRDRQGRLDCSNGWPQFLPLRRDAAPRRPEMFASHVLVEPQHGQRTTFRTQSADRLPLAGAPLLRTGHRSLIPPRVQRRARIAATSMPRATKTDQEMWTIGSCGKPTATPLLPAATRIRKKPRSWPLSASKR